MTWLRLDDKVHSHAKTVRAQNEAFGALVRMAAWCADHKTDGKIPREVALSFAGKGKVVARLIELRWLDTTEDPNELAVHDYLDWNPSAAELDSERERKRKNIETWRAKNRPVTGYTPDTKPVGIQEESRPTPTPTPTPTPKPTSTEPESAAPPALAPKATRKARDPEAPSAGQLYAKHYAVGITEASGEPYPAPNCHSTLAEIARTYAVRDGQPIVQPELLDWFRETAKAYRKARAEKAEWERGFTPAMCLSWLKSGRPGAGKPGPQRGSYDVQRSPEYDHADEQRRREAFVAKAEQEHSARIAAGQEDLGF